MTASPRATHRTLSFIRPWLYAALLCPWHRGVRLSLVRVLSVAIVTLSWPASAQVSWTPGFSRCVSTFDPSAANYYEDRSECPIGNNRQWLLGIQSEATLGHSCTGPNAQSLPINAGGPVTLSYEPLHGRSSVRLRTDFYNYPHPCPGEAWTWFSIMDHAWGGGGPLPNANDLTVHISGTYNAVAGLSQTRLGRIAGISRMGVTWQGFWGGKSLLVDVMLYLHPLWGDSHPASDIVYVTETPTFTYVVAVGPQWLLNDETSSVIPFHSIVRDMIQRGLLPAPAPNEPLTTAAVGPFTEAHTLKADGESIAVDFLIKDFSVF